MQKPTPTEITLLKQTRTLKIVFDDGMIFELPCDYLRVYSPSAETKDYPLEILALEKKFVNITAIESVGNYAVRLVFDDGHRTGIYSWDVLYGLGTQYKNKLGNK